MTKNDFYEAYQSNLKMLEHEINLVKKSTQMAIGHKLWLEENDSDSCKMVSSEIDIQAGTRLFAFLICSWLEARLMKILYESSSAAFTDREISYIRRLPSMTTKWKESFSIAVCKSYNFSYISGNNCTNNFTMGCIQKQNYDEIYSLFVDIDDAITIRNRLAHGQWNKQFNSNNNVIVNYPFFSTYSNIQKMDILRQYYNQLAEIISSYVTYKDKLNPNFDIDIKNKIIGIRSKKKRIDRSDFQKYSEPFKRIEQNNREAFRR